MNQRIVKVRQVWYYELYEVDDEGRAFKLESPTSYYISKAEAEKAGEKFLEKNSVI